MEDYTYNLVPGKEGILGSHMLEVCPTIADSTDPASKRNSQLEHGWQGRSGKACIYGEKKDRQLRLHSSIWRPFPPSD